MNETTVQCLTPSGSGAIATIAVSGMNAWHIVRRLFRPAELSKPLPERPKECSTWYGSIGDGKGDEVIVAVLAMEPNQTVEIHCHGGRQVVRWLTGQLRREGCVEKPIDPNPKADPWAVLSQAKTLRTAAILLDQANGAFDRALEEIAQDIQKCQSAESLEKLQDLRRFAKVGKHLIEPWRVVIAGAPNSGKSSLLNAMAGYQRSVVAPIPGTTRDVVSTTLAFDGWLMELSDTAGLHRTQDLLEREGIARARKHLAEADLCLWVLDSTAAGPTDPDEYLGPDGSHVPIIVVLNKTDLEPAWNVASRPEAVKISAVSGAGIDELIQRLIAKLIPDAPAPGGAVPYCDESVGLVVSVFESLKIDRYDEALNRIKAFRNVWKPPLRVMAVSSVVGITPPS